MHSCARGRLPVQFQGLLVLQQAAASRGQARQEVQLLMLVI